MTGGKNTDYKVHIVEAVLFARKAVLSPTVQMVHIKVLEKRTIRAVDCKVYSIPQAAMSHTHENLFAGHCRNDSYCGESRTTPTTATNLKTHSTPRATPLTSRPSPSTDVRFRPNRYSQTSRPASTFEATSTCFPPPVNKHMTNASSCCAMTLAKATPSSASIYFHLTRMS